MTLPILPYRRIDKGLPAPTRSHPHDAGLDLYAAREAWLPPGRRHLMPTGVAVLIPAGYVGLVYPRSGLAHKHGITLANAVGVIDSGYIGEIQVNLINHGEREVQIERGDRIAQLVLQKIELPQLMELDDLGETLRGEKGHGSTG